MLVPGLDAGRFVGITVCLGEVRSNLVEDGEVNVANRLSRVKVGTFSPGLTPQRETYSTRVRSRRITTSSSNSGRSMVEICDARTAGAVCDGAPQLAFLRPFDSKHHETPNNGEDMGASG
jgi:hypothetical protein